MEHGGWTYIFLRGGRKAWHHDQHKHGWVEVAHERGDHLECGVYRKLTPDVTAEDRENWVSSYGERPTDGEWFDPSGWQDPQRSAIVETPAIERSAFRDKWMAGTAPAVHFEDWATSDQAAYDLLERIAAKAVEPMNDAVDPNKTFGQARAELLELLHEAVNFVMARNAARADKGNG